MRLDQVVLGVVLELQSPAMSVTNKELEGRFITDLRPELCRRDMRTQAPDLGNPQGCKPPPGPSLEKQCIREKTHHLATLKCTGRVV